MHSDLVFVHTSFAPLHFFDQTLPGSFSRFSVLSPAFLYSSRNYFMEMIAIRDNWACTSASDEQPAPLAALGTVILKMPSAQDQLGTFSGFLGHGIDAEAAVVASRAQATP